jgi:hypothetical protein
MSGRDARATRETLPLRRLQARRAPRPYRRDLDQARFDGIVFDVLYRAGQMVFVPHIAIEVVGMPKGTRAAELCVGPLRGEGFPASNDLAQGRAVEDFDYDMDMVRHDAPRQQPVTVLVEVKQCALDERSDLRLPQPACAQACIQFLVQPLQNIVVAAKVFDHGRQAVGQSKRDELDSFGRIEMGQVAARVPSLGPKHHRTACIIGVRASRRSSGARASRPPHES